MSFFSYEDIDQNAGGCVFGELTSVNHTAMTGTVRGVGVSIPIHYHCDSSLGVDSGIPFGDAYPDELDDGGSAAFAVGDMVAVMYRRKGNYEPLIIGHQSEIKVCCSFRFTIDGENTGELTAGVSFILYNESQDSVPIKNLEYDEDQGCWTFSVNTSGSTEEDPITCVGPFWAKYIAVGYKTTQYQGINESESFFGESQRLIMGDGTLYYDLMEALVGTTGYWEDWEDDLICGKHQWYATNGLCVTDETVSISDNILSIVSDTTPESVIFGANYLWYGDTFNDGKAIPSYKQKSLKLKLAFSSLKVNSWSQLMIWFEDDSEIVLIFSTTDSYSNPLPSGYYHIGDNDGEEMELDLTSAAYGSIEQPIVDFLFYSTAVSDGTGGDIAILSIDYIDFPMWEDWNGGESEVDLCANNNWSVWTTGPEWEYVSCPELPWTNDLYVVSAHGTQSLTLANGILSFIINAEQDDMRSMDLGPIWDKDNNLDSPDIPLEDKKMKIKFNMDVIGPGGGEDVRSYGIYIVDDAGNIAFLYIYSVDTIPGPNDYSITDNGGEEQELDLSSYGLTGNLIYLEISFWLWEEPCVCNLIIDYIDFI